ncbi:hypothetical protein B0H13DRAFT_1915595 [Mycena leptocephala]|nr:hypothetical protein B0H13DRAFT_1915595 [Mycena leptocephala]
MYIGDTGKINSDGKVQLGSGSGHFALNAEPEPGIRFRFGSAFERVRTQQSSGILVGMKLLQENTNRCLLSFSRLYEFFEITSTRFDGLQAKLFHQRFGGTGHEVHDLNWLQKHIGKFGPNELMGSSSKSTIGSMSERNSAVNVEPDVQCRFKTRLDLEPKYGVQFGPVQCECLFYNIQVAFGGKRAIWCILGFLKETEMHNKEEKHRMCISTLYQRVGQSSAGDAIMLEGRIMWNAKTMIIWNVVGLQTAVWVRYPGIGSSVEQSISVGAIQ